MPKITCACNHTVPHAVWERIRAYLLRYHGTKEVDTETLQAVLGPSIYEDADLDQH